MVGAAPAQIATVNDGEGGVTLRFHGRAFDRGHREVRIHIPYLAYFVAFVPHTGQEWDVVRQGAENLTSTFVIVGVVFEQYGCLATPRGNMYEGRRFLERSTGVSITCHIDHVVAVRACRGVVTMPAFPAHRGGEVFVWRSGVDAGSVVACSPAGNGLTRVFPGKAFDIRARAS